MLSGIREKRYKIHSGQSFVIDHSFCEEYGSIAREPNLTFAQLIHDEETQVTDNRILLEGYFNDLYKLFLRKLAAFDCQSTVDDKERKKLRLLLDEMIKVKGILSEK